MKLDSFIPKAWALILKLEDHDFLMVDHDFNINVNRGFDDAKLQSYLQNAIKSLTNKVSRTS
jgi:hypothetical protein